MSKKPGIVAFYNIFCILVCSACPDMVMLCRTEALARVVEAFVGHDKVVKINYYGGSY